MPIYSVYRLWFTIISIILCCFGIIFTIFGFTFFPEQILPRNALLPWVSGIYGSIMIGWGITLLLIGRYAFLRKDILLLKSLLLGIFIWLIIEALVSLYVGVYFNIGVDVAVFILFGLPISLTIRTLRNDNKE